MTGHTFKSKSFNTGLKITTSIVICISVLFCHYCLEKSDIRRETLLCLAREESVTTSLFSNNSYSLTLVNH